MVMNMSWSTTGKKQAITKNETDEGKYALRKKELLQVIKQIQENNTSYLCLGIWGEPKSAKSATALDILTDEDIENDMKVMVFDFDNRAIDVKRNQR